MCLGVLACAFVHRKPVVYLLRHFVHNFQQLQASLIAAVVDDAFAVDSCLITNNVSTVMH
jgi:hypothetical protein